MQRGSFDEATTVHQVAISQDLLVSPPAIYPGQKLADRYTVGERIGGGGMADVFRGRDLYLYRDVAIKVIKHGMASAEMCGRMLQEGRATAAIDHPHLLRVLDFGRVGATVYLVTDLLRGCSLAEHLRSLPGSRLAWRPALELLLPALDALARIHDHGLVHRDLKPDNLFVHHRDGREALIVLDLGIAKVSPALRGGGILQTTESGRVLGTPAYMSPEQAGGKPLDHRTDIYSIGVTLYRMLAGRLPFEAREGEGPIVLMTHHLYDAPPRLDRFATELPEPLIDRVMQALAKAPAERPQSMRALAEALRDCLPVDSQRAAAAPTRARDRRLRRLRWWSLLAVLVGLRGVHEAASTPMPGHEPRQAAAMREVDDPPDLPRASAPAFTLAVLPDRPGPANPSPPDPPDATPPRPPHDPKATARILDLVTDPVADCIERLGGIDRQTLRVTWTLRPDGQIVRTDLQDGEHTLLALCVRPLVGKVRFAPGTPPRLAHTFHRVTTTRRP